MQAHPDYWCEEDEQDTVLRDRMADVQACASIAEIFATLGLDDFRGY